MAGRLMILGAGGHARVVANLALVGDDFEIVSAADDRPDSLGEDLGGVTVTHCFDSMDTWRTEGFTHVALGIGDNRKRAALFDRTQAAGLTPATLIHPTAILDRPEGIDMGTIICAGCVLGTGARLGRGVILNTGAIVDHESVVGDFAHIAPGAAVAGRVRIGARAMIGIGARIVQTVSIGEAATVGAGAVVLEDVAAATTVVGIPARLLEEV